MPNSQIAGERIQKTKKLKAKSSKDDYKKIKRKRREVKEKVEDVRRSWKKMRIIADSSKFKGVKKFGVGSSEFGDQIKRRKHQAVGGVRRKVQGSSGGRGEGRQAVFLIDTKRYFTYDKFNTIEVLANLSNFVTPAKAGVQNALKRLDSGWSLSRF